MNMREINIKRYILLSAILLASLGNLSAQPEILSYVDMGTNSVSDGFFFRTSGIASWRFGKYSVGTGIQLDFRSENENFLTALTINAARDFKIGNFHFTLREFSKWTYFSGLIRMPDYGLQAEWYPSRFSLVTGIHARTYVLTEKAIAEYDLESEKRIHEKPDLVYLGGISLYKHKCNSSWNIGLALTNIDYFSVMQAANPLFNINGYYRLKPNLDLFGETWLKTAGMFNSNNNYFGLNFRAGIIWNIKP
jgi:hypothetical protein